MNNLLFSVVIPTYNSSKSITKTIYSVLSQNYQNFEIVSYILDLNDKNQEIMVLVNQNQIGYVF